MYDEALKMIIGWHLLCVIMIQMILFLVILQFQLVKNQAKTMFTQLPKNFETYGGTAPPTKN